MRRHSHVAFQLFSQKSTGIPVNNNNNNNNNERISRVLFHVKHTQLR